MAFVAHHESAEVEQPADGSFDFVPPFVPSELAMVLQRRLLSVTAMRTDQLDSPFCQTLSQGITVGGAIVDQTLRTTKSHSSIEQWFDQLDFCRAGAGGVNREGRSFAVDQEHDLGSLAALGLADVGAPFFAGENVPSAITSSHRKCSRPSSFPRSRAQACSNTPDSVHSFSRRQHVEGEGNCVGKSFQRAPLRSTHSTPSKQGRGSTRGRPPSDVISETGNKSAIRIHCASVSCGFGSVLDPVQLRPRRGQYTRVINMGMAPFIPNRTQFSSQHVH